MDADTIRLILFLAGIALILGIYLWDRHKKNDIRIHAVRKIPREELPQPNPKEQENRKEPIWAAGVDKGGPADDDEDNINRELERLGALVQEGSDPKADLFDAAEQTAFSFGPDESQAFAPDLGKDIPIKILQLNIISRRGSISGEQITQAARDVALEAGDMQIYHRYEGLPVHGQIAFSMASLIEPGTFPLKNMSEFVTPGVTLFTQLPGPKDGIALFSDMLATAEQLATILDGNIEDETHSDLSRQTIEHIREEIIEHQRQVRLATTKR